MDNEEFIIQSHEIKYIIQTSRSKWQPYNISVPLDLKVTQETRLILNIIYVWKSNQTVLELDFWAVNFFLFFPRRDLNSHHSYTAAPIAKPYVQHPRPLDHIHVYATHVKIRYHFTVYNRKRFNGSSLEGYQLRSAYNYKPWRTCFISYF